MLNYNKIFFLVFSFFIFNIVVVVGIKNPITTSFLNNKKEITFKKEVIIKKKYLIGTIYHANSKETDSTFLITASGRFIDTNKLKNNKLRYVALSRDLLKVFNKSNGIYKYGDKILVKSKYKEINGIWIVVDCMNKRWKNKIDFLVPNKINNRKYKKIEIETIL